MPLKFNIEMSEADLKNLNAKIAEIQEYPEEAKNIMKHEAEQTVGRMRSEAPVKSGRLRREIEQVSTRKTIIVESRAIDPQTKVDYAPIQEYGLNGYRPQPYFRKNIRAMIVRLTKRLKRALSNKIKR